MSIDLLSILETKREVWLWRTGFGIAPVNKLVSLTWLLWALRSFRSFTLHYIHPSIPSSSHAWFRPSIHSSRGATKGGWMVLKHPQDPTNEPCRHTCKLMLCR